MEARLFPDMMLVDGYQETLPQKGGISLDGLSTPPTAETSGEQKLALGG